MNEIEKTYKAYFKRKKKYLTIFFSVVLTLLVLIIVSGYLTASEYFPYSESTITITAADNNLIIVHLGDTGFRYNISNYRADDNSGDVYDISMWNSAWNRMINKNVPADFIINPNGEMVSSVYYCSNDGKEDILIYGKNQNPNGGVITLPHLVLSYYVIIAAVGTVILGGILFLFRKKQKVKAIIFKLFVLPISYLLGHICIKGFSTSSYSATRDFYAILLAMIPIYCAIMIGERIFASRT